MGEVLDFPLKEDLLDRLTDEERVPAHELIEVDTHTQQLDQAGVDQLTAVDTFMEINGTKVFITGEEYYAEN